jgi:hypothetical protein
MNAGKGVAVVSVVEGFIFMSIVAWIEIYSGGKVLLNTGKWTIGIIFLALYYLNYYLLVTCRYGVNFERGFNSLEKRRKSILLTSLVALILAVIAFSAYSVSAYQRFFHIVPKSGW